MSGHVPVLLGEVVAAVAPVAGDLVVDATFGAGGYARAILDAADCTLYAIDQDPDAVSRAHAVAASGYRGRLHFLTGRFGQMDRLLQAAGVSSVDAVVLDIGVSSFQLDEAKRGFSFQQEGPLDMRMSQEGESAGDVINTYGSDALIEILRQYGEEPRARKIVDAIIQAREEDGPFETTLQLATLVEKVAPGPKPRPGKKRTHPATRTFQALRIHVNDELGELQRGLVAAEALLKPGGRLAVVSFHSLEDRLVKSFLSERAGRLPAGSRHRAPRLEDARPPSFHLRKMGAVKPSAEEQLSNSRSRSARLRVAERTAAAAWGEGR